VRIDPCLSLLTRGNGQTAKESWNSSIAIAKNDITPNAARRCAPLQNQRIAGDPRLKCIKNAAVAVQSSQSEFLGSAIKVCSKLCVYFYGT
jgi:hypothetical protein